ncbi:hypothetical protein DSL72_004238 [Monilinia vaccinii-corymbosi]|uniref:Uncharacterized protein n=1 Tax=Monilinia vaccinii-corymbosi TaxID=61207 RepID=A0A8A3P471_9HELO|nr:hypothetical protein DSL72_004238 [Monilinia vaccinii-corymbosi]
MSWMDSWSRPSKHSAVPPPLYLTAGQSVPYCLACGRVMSTKKASKKPNNEVKYCSDRCRNRKPGKLDRNIEQVIVALLDQEEGSGIEKTGAKDRFVKGDHRVVVTCHEIEEIVFGSRFDPAKIHGRRKNRRSRAIGGSNTDTEWKTVDMESSEDSAGDDAPLELMDTKSGPMIRPPQSASDVNFSVGGERGRAERMEESASDLQKKIDGQKQAEEREMVRRAARRAVVFGFVVDQPPETFPSQSSKGSKHKKSTIREEDVAKEPIRRKCEALMQGSVVEPSFAKGNWSIRWRQ